MTQHTWTIKHEHINIKYIQDNFLLHLSPSSHSHPFVYSKTWLPVHRVRISGESTHIERGEGESEGFILQKRKYGSCARYSVLILSFPLKRHF